MKFFAVMALVAASFACANKPAGPEKPQLANGRCSCESGALCLVPAGQPASAAVCAPAATAGLGCASFTNATRSCWGSPQMAGLCLCSGGDTTKLATAQQLEFVVEAALLVNEGGVQCTPVVFARPLTGAPVTLSGANAYLGGARVAGLDPRRAAERGPGLVAFVLDDPMDVRSFNPGDRVRLEER